MNRFPSASFKKFATEKEAWAFVGAGPPDGQQSAPAGSESSVRGGGREAGKEGGRQGRKEAGREGGPRGHVRCAASRRLLVRECQHHRGCVCARKKHEAFP